VHTVRHRRLPPRLGAPSPLPSSTDGAGWTVETVDLYLTGRQRGEQRVSTEPLGDGPQLLVRRPGHVVAYVADTEDLAALGADVSRMAVARRW
jgi:hypothetical protein